MAVLRPLKSEVDAVAALLVAGADTPEALADAVIREVERLRGYRQSWFSIFEMSPGIYQGYGPYSTRAAAEKAAPKLPISQIAPRGAFVPVLGPDIPAEQLAAADAPPSERSDFALVREDAAAFRAGWKGKERDRSKFVTT